MGGSGSRHTVEYRTDPSVLAALDSQRTLIQQITAQLDDARREAKERSDPQLFRQQQKRIFAEFLARLDTMQFTDPIPEALHGARHVLVTGDVSVGKSSLLNTLFDIQPPLPTGIGHTTEGVDAVYNHDGAVVVWDSKGANQDFEFYNPDALNMVKGVDLIIVLYSSSLSTVENIVRVVLAIKSGLSGVAFARTQCDNHSAADVLTVDQEMERDRAFLATLTTAASTASFFRTSKRGGFDNDALRSMILGGGQ